MISKGKQIGKGTFSTVFEDTANSDKVWIVSTDKAKEAVAEGIAYSEMLPSLERQGFATDNDEDMRAIYHGDRYAKVRAPKRELNPKAFKQYQQLRKASLTMGLPYNEHDSYNVTYKAFEMLEDKGLSEEMLSILDGYSNYGSDVAFEISPRNIAVGADGQLILLDCFYFKTDLLKVRFNH